MQKEPEDKSDLYKLYLQALDAEAFVDNVTAEDLYIDQLFDQVDRTVSWPGRQLLYAQLHRQNYSGFTTQELKQTEQLTNNQSLSSQIDKCLGLLDHYEASNLVRLFSLELPEVKNRFIYLVNSLRIAGILLVFLFFAGFYKCAIIGFIVVFVANMLFHYKNKLNLAIYEHSIPQITRLIKCADKIMNTDLAGIDHPAVSESISRLKVATKSIRWFKQSKILMSDLAIVIWGIQELLKIISLIEVYSFNITLKRLAGNQAELEKLYCFVGKVDMLHCIVKIRNENQQVCIPQKSLEKNHLSFSNITHPLIENCVKNSMALQSKSVLLTGSNMSGKSTFIRAVGLNVLLAQNLQIAFAERFEMSYPLSLHTVMNVKDNLLDSKSLFFSEVLEMRAILNRAPKGNHLFLLDEMFKGTNTLERVAAANGVLSYLAAQNMVIVATHDIELTKLLAGTYELYHFCEQVNNGSIDFDYKLKKGVITEFNALKILAMNEYPDEVLEKAYSTIMPVQA